MFWRYLADLLGMEGVRGPVEHPCSQIEPLMCCVLSLDSVRIISGFVYGDLCKRRGEALFICRSISIWMQAVSRACRIRSALNLGSGMRESLSVRSEALSSLPFASRGDPLTACILSVCESDDLRLRCSASSDARHQISDAIVEMVGGLIFDLICDLAELVSLSAICAHLLDRLSGA